MVAGRRLPRGKRQDVRRTFGFTIRRHAETLLRDYYNATQEDLALRVVLQFGRRFHERGDVLQRFARCHYRDLLLLSGVNVVAG